MHWKNTTPLKPFYCLMLAAICCLVPSIGCGPKKPAVKVAPPDASKPKEKASQRPYTVDGQKYEPLKTHEGFTQKGVASWYGKDFHGKKTSNGEKYDMHAMTAAHKTLPLGVFVKVRNTDNGRETVVRVNDRGPFAKGRVIDLSYAAAQKIGIDIVGTGPVQLEALGYRSTEAEQYNPPASYDTGSYTVQIGSFRDQNNARRLQVEIAKQYGFSEIHTTTIDNDLYFRVYAGKYSSLRDAERAEQEFSERGYPGSFTVSLD